MDFSKKFVRQDDGSVAIEYGLVASLVSLAILATLLLFGPWINATLQAIADLLGL